MGGGEGREKGTVYWKGGGRGGPRERDSVLEGWEEGEVEERGEIACSIIATTYAGGSRGGVVNERGGKGGRGGVGEVDGGGLWLQRLSAAVKTRQSKVSVVGCHSQSPLAGT